MIAVIAKDHGYTEKAYRKGDAHPSLEYQGFGIAVLLVNDDYFHAMLSGYFLYTI